MGELRDSHIALALHHVASRVRDGDPFWRTRGLARAGYFFDGPSETVAGSTSYEPIETAADLWHELCIGPSDEESTVGLDQQRRWSGETTPRPFFLAGRNPRKR